MISYLFGKLAVKTETSVVVECGGIGFECAVSTNTLANLPLCGENVKILTFMQVKEDDISLIGFADIEEKNVFSKLIDVSGIGPKMALAILSGISTDDLVVAILKEDSKTLSNIKGLGKKTAERIILELKDKFDISALTKAGNEITKKVIPSDAVEDATEALVALGINRGEAYKMASTVAMENDNAESIITKVLKGMGR